MRKETILNLIFLVCLKVNLKISYQLDNLAPFGYGTYHREEPNATKNVISSGFYPQWIEENANDIANSVIEKLQDFTSTNYKRRNGIAFNEKKDGINVLATYPRYFVVKIKGGEKRASLIIRNYGYKRMIQVFPCDNYYLVENIHNRSRFKRDDVNTIGSDEQILRILPQQNFKRFRRSDYESFTRPERKHRFTPMHFNYQEMNFNDPYYKDQWYLHHYGWHHLNIQTVWRAGYTGRNVRITILDDGIHPDNPDLGINYDSSISYDYVHFEEISESNVEENSHGTSCAGIIAALANNSLCGVGIAYNARIGGCRVLDGPMTDAQEAMSLVHAIDRVDIYSASWGPRDDGKHLAKPGILSKRAFFKGITEGRNGKGSIYVWASGNGGKYDDHCNMDGYASNIYTIAIGALSHHGRSTYYTETCPATLASTYVGGFHLKPNLEALLRGKNMTKVIVPGDHGNCRRNFQGTSAAAPLAAGLIALLLEANPELTWRDVQYIIIISARIPSGNEKGWMMNAAGYHYHNKIGFGVMDCGRMISTAQNWIPVAPQKMFRVIQRKRRYIQEEYTKAVLTVENENIPSENRIYSLEYVVATLSIKHIRRGNLRIYLTSPSNTVSQLLAARPNDLSRSGFQKWKFKTVHFWGENPTGEWLLEIQDLDSDYSRKFKNYIDFFSLTFYGTSRNSNKPNDKMMVRDSQFEKHDINTRLLWSISKKERLISRSVVVQKISDDSQVNEIPYKSNNYPKCLN